MRVEYVMDQAKYTIVDVLISQPEIVIVTGTCSMSVEFVADQVSQKETVTATETYSMSVVLVAGPASQKETVTATETY